MLKTDLSTKEAKALTKDKCMEMIRDMDDNNDGKLSLDEFTVLYEQCLGLIPRDSEALPEEPAEGEEGVSPAE